MGNKLDVKQKQLQGPVANWFANFFQLKFIVKNAIIVVY